MKTGKAFWGWVTMASIFVAVGTMFVPNNKSNIVRRIVDKAKKRLGMEDGLLTKHERAENASPRQIVKQA